MLKIILIGHPGSQHIVKASTYLTAKYLPGFSITYLNYEGEINGWSKYVADYLKTLDDDKIIFALDDYLVSKEIDQVLYEGYLEVLDNVINTVCAKLCTSTKEEHEEYPVTTQYCIWKRKDLIEILEHTTSPWDFEMRGSSIFRLLNKLCYWRDIPALEYDVHSALSNRWQGINLTGLKEEDINYLKQHEYI